MKYRPNNISSANSAIVRLLLAIAARSPCDPSVALGLRVERRSDAISVDMIATGVAGAPGATNAAKSIDVTDPLWCDVSKLFCRTY